jgi:ligand-binding sensor domain-containing protein
MKRTTFQKVNKSIVLFWLLLLSPVVAFSQLSDWKNYTNGDMVTKILNDGDYLWIATDGGLVKMHKTTEEKTFYNRANTGLPDNHIRGLAKDINGDIWVASQYNGIGKFDGTNCTVYKKTNNSTDQHCYSIAIDNENNVWAGTLFYLNRFDGEKWESWTTPNSALDAFWAIYDLKFDTEGMLWMGGASVVSHFYFAGFNGSNIEILEEIDTPVLSIEIDKDNNKWLGTEAGLVKYDGVSFTTYNTNNSNLPDNTIHAVKKDASGNLWLACGKQLVKFDGTDFTTHNTSLITGDDNNFIYCLEPEDNGTVWIGTRRNGLIKFSNGTFRQINLGNSPLLSNDIAYSLDIDEDYNVRFGTKYNLVTIDKNNRWSSSYENIGNMTTDRFRINGIASDLSGNRWIALGRSDTCLLKINNNSSTVVFTEQNSPLIRQIFEYRFAFDKKGNTWIATGAGLYKYDGSVWSRYHTGNAPLTSNAIGNIVLDKDDNLWGAAGNNGCLFKYDGVNWTVYTPDDTGLPTRFVSTLAFDSKNNLWVHCRDADNVVGREFGGGLTKFDGSEWITYNIDNSDIPSNSILDIAVDKDDNLWLATIGRVGVTKFDGTHWESYNVDNSGIAFDEVSKITLDYYRDLIWFNHLYSSGLSTAKLNSNTGINNMRLTKEAKGFTVYTNPSDASIIIRLQGINMENINVYDISGKLIASGNKYHGTEIQIPLFKLNMIHKGLYLIRINSSQGETYCQKIFIR